MVDCGSSNVVHEADEVLELPPVVALPSLDLAMVGRPLHFLHHHFSQAQVVHPLLEGNHLVVGEVVHHLLVCALGAADSEPLPAVREFGEVLGRKERTLRYYFFDDGADEFALNEVLGWRGHCSN